jgi:hypothetical protein
MSHLARSITYNRASYVFEGIRESDLDSSWAPGVQPRLLDSRWTPASVESDSTTTFTSRRHFHLLSSELMRHCRQLKFVVLSIGVLAAMSLAQDSPNPAGQCDGDCALDRPPCENAWLPWVSAVFLGTATSIKEQSVPVVVDGERAQTTKQTVSFSVDEAFRGVEGSFATVTSGGDLCGFPFYKQKRYLIYAGRQKDGTLHVSICGGTKLLADAANDLVYLRTIATRAPSGFIFGTVFKYADPANSNARVPVVRLMRAVTGQQVRIRGRQSYTVVVNEKGQFRLDGVEAGRYEISIDIQDSAGSNPSKIVDVAAKGCASATFIIDPSEQRVVIR